MTDTGGESVKDVAKSIWKNKPLAITILVGLAAVAYIIYKRSGGSAAVTSTAAAATDTSGVATADTSGTTPTSYVREDIHYYVGPAQSVAPIGVPTIGPMPPQPVQPPKGPPAPPRPQPGTTFRGPTGVNHYVATGKQTLTQIASAFGLTSWNSIYAIPDNQRAFGKMNAQSAAVYVPGLWATVVLPH